jgi:hypothetical protein
MRTASLSLLLVAGLVASAAAAEIEFPSRKPGQWKIEMHPQTGPAMTVQVCLDAATDKQMMEAGMSISKDMCPTYNMTRGGGSIVIEAACTFGAMKTTSHTVMTGDFESAYDVTITSTMEGGPPGMPANSTMTQHAEWTGDCANGLKPGEMLMPGGMKVNVQQMLGGMGGG